MMLDATARRLKEAFRVQGGTVPWSRMAHSGIAMAAGLAVGYLFFGAGIAIFVALASTFAVVFDFGGRYPMRLWPVLIGTAAMVAGALVGLELAGRGSLLIPAVLLFASVLGRHFGAGMRTDFIIRFAVLALTVGSGLPGLTDVILVEFLLGIGLGLVIGTLSEIALGPIFVQPGTVAEDWQAIRRGQVAGWRFGLLYGLCVAGGLALGLVLGLAKPYWIAATVAFVMQPKIGASFGIVAQRAAGTLLALPVIALWSQVADNPASLAGMAVIGAFLQPLAQSRAYWLGCAAVVLYVVPLLDLAHFQLHGALPLVFLRIGETLIGCAVAGAGLAVLAWTERKPS